MEWKDTNEDEKMDQEDDCIIIEQSVEDMADQRKHNGNLFYKENNYDEALKCYTDAINLCPTCAAYYGNRAATYMMLNRYKDALDDARRAVEIDNTFVKGHLREGKCHLALGSTPAAIQCYQRVLLLEPGNTVAPYEMQMAQKVQELSDLAANDFESGETRRALFYMDRCLEMSPACNRFKIQKAEALAILGRYQESQEVSNDVLQRDRMNADAVYVRGLCLYYEDNVEKALQHFQQVLRLAPDHRKARDVYKRAKGLIAKKDEGNAAFRAGKFAEAFELYSQALSIDPRNKFTNSKLYCNRATVCSKINKLDQAIEDCSKAIELDDTYIKAYLRRAKCYMDTEQYEEAVRDYDKLTKLDKSRENKRLLQEAKLALKRSKRKDFYKILGVAKEATDDEIKKAYKKRALLHHPDRHSHAEPEIQKEEEKKFKELGEAYSVLSDAKKRLRYDQGQDLEDLDGPGFDHIDPNQIFQAFFGGNQGFSFGGSNFGGMGGSSFHSHSSQFPGEFTFQFG